MATTERAGTMEEVTRTFRAMNTDVLAIVAVDPVNRDDPAPTVVATMALEEVEQLFATVEACASRFRSESELSHLNRSAGRPFAASPLLYALVDAALHAAADTNGAFDPTLLDELERAGYDRSFDQLPKERAAATGNQPATAQPMASAATWRDVRLDPVARTIAVPPGCRIDLGGIGKGWTVDQAGALLRRRGFRSFAVDAGGDLYAAGRQGDGAPWSVGVSDPARPERDLATLSLNGSGVATSTTARRRWQVGGEVRHHLIDPRTRRPAAAGVTSATVVADTVSRAETLAKAALVLGPVAGHTLLERQRVAGMLILESGGLVRVGPPVFTKAA